MGTVVMGLWSGCRCQVIEDIKSCNPEVKASKADKQLQSYGHLKITIKNYYTKRFVIPTYGVPSLLTHMVASLEAIGAA